MKYKGGYLVLNSAKVRRGMYAHTAGDLSKISPITTKALNAIQATPWQINPDTSEIFFRLFTDDKPNEIIRGFTPTRPKIERVPEEIWSEYSKKDKADRRRENHKIHEAFDIAKSEFMKNEMIFTTASEVADKPRIWFPANMDFRTRIYPVPSVLNPQGEDLAKGLIRFADGKPLRERGLHWLMIGIANAAGQDKLNFFDRCRWVNRNEDMLRRIVRDPIRYADEWAIQFKDDDPWQLLALAHEFIRACDWDNPENYPNQVPVHVDGTCNGAQHLSLMSRDLIGAEATNCRNVFGEYVRNDLYMDVADRVFQAMLPDFRNGVAEAVELLPRMENPSVRRKMVKRSVMTVPYGVTDYGVARFMIDDKHVEGTEQPWLSARYLRDLIMASIDQTLSNGRLLQAWFSTCAEIVATAGLPLQWDSPVGSKITQGYKTLSTRRIRLSTGRHILYEETDDAGMNVSKMSLAASPNVVHSCDASHLQDTTCRMVDTGITHFSMIHDSCGTHAGDVETMGILLRRSAYDLYADNYLNAWRDSVIGYSGVDIPEPPPMGEYDINEILTAPYFFA